MDTFFHVLVQNSADAVVILDAGGGILFASESATPIGGYTLDERAGRSGFEMIHPDDVTATRARFEECVRRPGVPARGA
jgi:PAS domain S-box-containing protein